MAAETFVFPEHLVRLTMISERVVELEHIVGHLVDELDRYCTEGIVEMTRGEFSDAFNEGLIAEARRRIAAAEGGHDAR
jgi:hypothetical protein